MGRREEQPTTTTAAAAATNVAKFQGRFGESYKRDIWNVTKISQLPLLF